MCVYTHTHVYKINEQTCVYTHIYKTNVQLQKRTFIFKTLTEEIFKLDKMQISNCYAFLSSNYEIINSSLMKIYDNKICKNWFQYFFFKEKFLEKVFHKQHLQKFINKQFSLLNVDLSSKRARFLVPSLCISQNIIFYEILHFFFFFGKCWTLLIKTYLHKNLL